MSTPVTILFGLLCAALGVWGAIATWPLVWTAAVAVALAALMLGGVLAMLIGISELRDRASRRDARQAAARETKAGP